MRAGIPLADGEDFLDVDGQPVAVSPNPNPSIKPLLAHQAGGKQGAFDRPLSYLGMRILRGTRLLWTIISNTSS